jgi:hypothetical protein
MLILKIQALYTTEPNSPIKPNYVVNKTTETQTLTCPNTACGKNFSTPLSTVNRRYDEEKKFNACPFCLTKLPVKESPMEETDSDINSSALSEDQSGTDLSMNNEDISDKERTEDIHDSSSQEGTCNHYLGYLGKEKNRQIPDDCLVCLKIIECMR